MRIILCQILVTICPAACLAAETRSYFRSDYGIATPDTHALPSDLGKDQLLWRTPIGPGCSTPCLMGDRVVVTTFEKDRLFTVAIHLVDGTPIWKREAPATEIEAFHETGSAAAATPASNGQQVFAFFGSCGMLCYDRAGTELWFYPLGPFQDEWGAASSPILVDGKVIINQDHDVDSFLLALDQRTGNVVWRKSRAEFTRSYSTPMIWEQNGTPSIVVAGALQLVAYEVTQGNRLWSLGGLSRIVNPTPASDGDQIYVASWSPWTEGADRFGMQPWVEALAAWDTNGDDRLARTELPDIPVRVDFHRTDVNQDEVLDELEWQKQGKLFAQAENSVRALRPAPDGTLSTESVIWKFARGLPYVASPLVYRGIVYVVKDGGIVTSLDTGTGELLKRGRVGSTGRYYASPVAGDGQVYLASEDGVVSILQAAKDWKILSTHNFGERITATPIFVAGAILIRTDAALYCFRSN